MSTLKGNKIFAAVLIALLLALIATLISEFLISPVPLAKSVYVVDIPETDAVGQAAPKEDVAEEITPLLATANVEAGKKIAKKCVQCHTLEEGGAHRIGPALWDVMGKKQATKEGYAYSSAAKSMDKDWSYEELNAFLYKPRKYMPGTKMSFAGLKKTKDRANLIAYLRTLSKKPVPLP
jgi:cytochrome c